jgi:release factor glutamine methyltransferase
MPTALRNGNPGATGTSARPADPGSSPSIYPAREDTFLLLPFAEVDAGSTFLEVGTGSGLIALAAARRTARVVATDRNPHALRRLAALARAERLDLSPVRTDLAAGLGRFDRIVANPPYLPTRPGERDPDRWHNLALDGGPDGWEMTRRLVEHLGEHLDAEGRAFVLTSSLQAASGLREILDRWRSGGGTVVPVAERELEGERLTVYEFRPATTVTPRAAPRT